ncbi:MAG: hypothetical protein EPO07_03850, partial [Verrucomicrobia bacterium]
MNASSNKSTTTATELPGATEVVALLESLRVRIRDLTTRAAALDRDSTTRSTRLRAQSEQARERLRADSAAQLEAAETAAHTERARADEIFQNRKARIGRAAQAARERKITQIEAEEARRTVEVQHGLLAADQTRDAETAAANKAYEDFTALLAQEQLALEQTSQRARSTFGGYRSLTWLFTQSVDTKLELAGDENQSLEKLRTRLAAAERELARARALVLPTFFRFIRIWILLPVIFVMLMMAWPALIESHKVSESVNAWAVFASMAAVCLVAFFVSRRLATPAARAAAAALDEARTLHDACAARAQATRAAEIERAHAACTATTQELNATWKQIQA